MSKNLLGIWLLCSLWLAADAGATTLNVVVSTETAPAGGTVQLKLSLAQPAAISTGEIALDLPPALFGPVTAIAALSAAGDASGYASISANHLDIHFSSPSATSGSVAGMPLVVITVPTLAGAQPGAQAVITADPNGSPWAGAFPPPVPVYALTVTPGTVTIGGKLFVSDASPVSNLSADAVVRIRGAGFTSATTVDIAAVAVASVQPAGPEEIDVTLAGPADLGGKRITVSNPDGSQVVFFAAPPATPLASIGDVFDSVLPLFPTTSYAAGSSTFLEGAAFGRMALANPNDKPVDVLLQVLAAGTVSQQMTQTIPAGGSYNNDFSTLKSEW